jgi:hypothetical protein
MITLAAQPSGLGPSTGRGDTVSASDFGTVGGIGKSRGASCDTVNRGQDNDALGAHDLSMSTIGGGGPALCIPRSSGSSVGISGTGASDSGRSLPRDIAAAHWARLAATVMFAQAMAVATMQQRVWRSACSCSGCYPSSQG